MERIDPQGDKDHVTHEWVACNWLFLFFGRVSTVGVLLIWCVESNHLWIHVYTTYYNGMISRLILYLMSFLFIVSYAYSYYIYKLLYTKCHYQVATKQYQRHLRWWIEEEQTDSKKKQHPATTTTLVAAEVWKENIWDHYSIHTHKVWGSMRYL